MRLDGSWPLPSSVIEKGLLTLKDTSGLKLTWGNGEALMSLLNKIARREGLGNTLAEGAMRAAQQVGGEAGVSDSYDEGQYSRGDMITGGLVRDSLIPSSRIRVRSKRRRWLLSNCWD